MPVISRREIIKISGKSFLSISAMFPLLHSCTSFAEEKNAVIGWQDFISEIHSMAIDYEKPGFNEDLYLKKVTELAGKLNMNDKQIAQYFKNYQNRNKKFPEFRKMHKEKSFQVTLLEFEPGEKIPLHNHPDMSGVILCSEGEIYIENYDLLQKKSSNDKLLLKRTDAVTMTQGSLGSLSSTRGNIHNLEAKKFTRLI
ncbi:MAG: hypothetical protein NE330_10410, partial [Lentisphaeraceae bacterium]|nr:hypothetical protein [Lentisphaeraceae bacterium]